MKHLVDKLNTIVVKIGDILSWVYLFIVLISVYEVFVRYALNSPTVWVHETSIALAGIIMVYGGLYAFSLDKHISVSIIVDLFPNKIKKYLDLFAECIGLLYVIVLGISTFVITKLAFFTPGGSIRLERSGSSWNSIFPSVSKLMMLVFIILFAVVIACTFVSKLMEIIVRKNK